MQHHVLRNETDNKIVTIDCLESMKVLVSINDYNEYKLGGENLKYGNRDAIIMRALPK